MRYIANTPSSLLEALKIHFPDSSGNTLKGWIKQERVLVNGELASKASMKLQPGDEIRLAGKKKWVEGGVEILYDDPSIVVIFKPEGLLSVATELEKEKTAHAYLKKYYHPKRVFVVHRLDQDTSGVMLFALSEEAMAKMKNLFEAHDIERRYLAIVEGGFDEDSGCWDSYLYEDPHYKVHITDDPKKGERAVTHYQLIDKTGTYSLMECRLETGKKNQIRVHCQHAGHPVVGDKKYGASRDPVKRLCLHAYHLGFVHPETGKKLTFAAPVPEEFYRLIPKRDDA